MRRMVEWAKADKETGSLPFRIKLAAMGAAAIALFCSGGL
jgi:hypothetical protein